MRNEEMTRGKKLAMLFFLAVAAAFMLSFARPQAAQAKTYKICFGKKNKATVYSNGKKMKGRTITLKEGAEIKKSECKFTLRNKKGKVLYGWKVKVKNNAIAQYQDGALIALKAGTTKVTIKRGKKKIAFKVKVKSNGLKVSAKSAFDYNLVSKGWVKMVYRDNHDIDGDDEYEEANPTDAQLKSEFMAHYKNLTSEVSKTHKMTKNLDPNLKLKCGAPYNVVYITVKNNTSHKAILPKYINPSNHTDFVSNTSDLDINSPKGIHFYQTFVAIEKRFVSSTGKKTTVKPHSTATVKYVSINKNCLYLPYDTVAFQSGALANPDGWVALEGFEADDGIRLVGVKHYQYRISLIYPDRVNVL